MRIPRPAPAFVALLRKELLTTLKEKMSRAILIGPLLIYCLLFGYIATFNLENVPYVLCDLSHSTASDAFVRAVDASRVFRRVATVESSTAVTEAMEASDALLTVVVSENFAKQQASGNPADVALWIDGRNSSTAKLAAGYMAQIAEAVNAGRSTSEPAFVSRLLYNPNNITQWFIMPGIIVMLSMLQVLILSSLSVSREREQGTFEQLLVTPYTMRELLIAKAIIPTAIGIFQSTLILAIDILWFGIPFAGSFLTLYGVLIIFTASVVGVGLAISAASQTMQQSLLKCFFILVPMVLLSGLLSPVENMPDAIQYLTYLDPLRFALVAVRRVYLAGATFPQVFMDILPVLALAAVTLPLSYRFFRRRL